VPFQVVPGISSAIAAPAAAGIPITHRDVARSVAIVTASTAHGDGVDLSRVATATDTLVLLMAAGQLERTCADLIANGRSSAEPAALVMWATTEDQREVLGTLATLPALALAASIGPPATLVVGEVVTLAGELATLASRATPSPTPAR
jgi:uroporphyrinogen III methyltransferase/synthase